MRIFYSFIEYENPLSLGILKTKNFIIKQGGFVNTKEKRPSFAERCVKKYGVKTGLWMFASTQVGYTIFKLILVLFFEKPVESLFPEWIGKIVVHEVIVFIAYLYFGTIGIWVSILTYAVWKITNEKSISEPEKWQVFKLVLLNSHEIKRKKPEGKIRRIIFYGAVLMTAPWIWLTAIYRFINVKRFFNFQKEL